eukprot:TRINITY_DN806_c0_g1_i12.p1 TRINITY_DN806_c0_g1~~TRINITY_DN806_c0_g1_i12.p1  ORF type:complete len:595 (-),score=140.67 TRINITY_DN806_c0_g1_i12:297-2081(-)
MLHQEPQEDYVHPPDGVTTGFISSSKKSNPSRGRLGLALIVLLMFGGGFVIGYFAHKPTTTTTTSTAASSSSSGSGSSSSPSANQTTVVQVTNLISATANQLDSVRHIVLFKFSSATTAQNVTNLVQAFNALFNLTHKPNGASYMLSEDFGMSIDTAQYTHGWIVSFADEIDRDYYVGRPFQTVFDPAHDAFKALVGPYLYSSSATQQLATINPGVLVYDFTVTFSKPAFHVAGVGLYRQVILMRFNSTAQSSMRSLQAQFIDSMNALFDNCVNSSMQQYILQLESGYPNSHEGVDQSMNFGWILTFKSANDWSYFNTQDPVKLALFAQIQPWLDTNGLFSFSMPVASTNSRNITNYVACNSVANLNNVTLLTNISSVFVPNFAIPGHNFAPEGIFWDTTAQHFLFGSTKTGGIFSLRPGISDLLPEITRVVAPNNLNLGSVGVFVDYGSNRYNVWAALSNFSLTGSGTVDGGLLYVNMVTGVSSAVRLSQFQTGNGLFINDVVTDDAGNVFATNSFDGQIFKGTYNASTGTIDTSQFFYNASYHFTGFGFNGIEFFNGWLLVGITQYVQVEEVSCESTPLTQLSSPWCEPHPE